MSAFAGFELPRMTRAQRFGAPDTGSTARIAEMAPRLPWDKFVKTLNWKNGEHVGLIGTTGMGKTTLLQALLPLHPYVVVFATKPRDDSMTKLMESDHYLRMEQWRAISAKEFPRRVLWPDATRLDAIENQKSVFRDAMYRIYSEGGWTVAIDETYYFENMLRLGAEMKMYLLQARSLGISLITATQRPAWVPREIYSASTHLFFWRANDETDLRSLSGIGWLNGDLIREIVANLEPYQCLYINTRTGRMARTRAPKPKERKTR